MEVIATTTPQTTMVAISLEQLREFEAAVAEVAVLKAKRAKRVTNKLEDARTFDVEHPEKAAERRKRYKEAHREELNAKRREKRRLAKEPRGAPVPPNLKPPARIENNRCPHLLPPSALPVD